MKRPNITENTKANIVAAFWKLYQTTPIEHISINKLMETAGYHRSTFYLYFNSIYDVLYEFENEILNDIKKIAIAVQNQTQPVPTNDILYLVTEIYRKNGAYMLVLLGKNGDPSFPEKAKDVLRPLLLSNLQKHNVSLIFNEPVSEEFVFEYLSSTILNMMHFYLKSECQIPIEEFIVLVRQLIFNGISGLQTAKRPLTSW